MSSSKFLSLFLLVSLLGGLTGGVQPTALAADPPALIAVSLQAEDAIRRFQATDLPAYAFVDGYIIAGAGSDGQASLRSAGLSFQILDAELTDNYYLASRVPSSPRLDWSLYGRLLLDLGDQALLQISPAQVEQLSRAGVELRHITLLPILLPVDQITEQVFPEEVQYDPIVQRIIDQVSQDTLKQYVRQLSGEEPVWVNDAWYTITTRHTYSGKPIRKAARYMGERMADQGLDVEYQVWYDDNNPNVIGQITGLTNPADIYILGAHLDDVWDVPGADDNASGSAATLLAAELLSQYQWNCTLRFAFWTGEEQGLYGSAAYAWRSYNRGENILGYLNLDMLAWNTPDSSPDIDLVYHPDMPLTKQMARLMRDVIPIYSLNLIPQLVTSYGGFSDHSSFWDYGYTSIHAIEDQNDFNPHYHSSGDSPSHIDLAYLTDFTKASLATFMHMSNCLITGDLNGTVASEDGTVIPNAGIQISDAAGHVFSTWANDSGYYTQTLPASTYTITVSADGYLTETVPGIAVLGGKVTTQDFSLQTTLTQGHMEGQVTSAASGYPLQGASVIAFPYGNQVITGPNGYYSMTLTAGDYWVTARLSGYISQTVLATVDVSQTTIQDFALEIAPPEIDILPSAISVTLLLDRDTVKTTSVNNLGDSPLSFAITNPDAASWLSFTPRYGRLDPAASQVVSVTLQAAGLGTGVYPATLEFASDDPDTPLVFLPVTMTVVSDCVPVGRTDFTWMPVVPLAGEAVTFYASNNGSEPVSYYWEFSDGITSTADIPTRFFVDGVYTVTLTASNDCGVDDATYTITVAAPPWQSILPLVSKK